MDAELPQVFAQSGAQASHHGCRHLGFRMSRTEVDVFSPKRFLSGRLPRAFRLVRFFLVIFILFN